jgi:hypothetical protein
MARDAKKSLEHCNGSAPEVEEDVERFSRHRTVRDASSRIGGHSLVRDLPRTKTDLCEHITWTARPAKKRRRTRHIFSPPIVQVISPVPHPLRSDGAYSKP